MAYWQELGLLYPGKPSCCCLWSVHSRQMLPTGSTVLDAELPWPTAVPSTVCCCSTILSNSCCCTRHQHNGVAAKSYTVLLLTPCRRTPVAPQRGCFVGFFWVCSTSLPPTASRTPPHAPWKAPQHTPYADNHLFQGQTNRRHPLCCLMSRDVQAQAGKARSRTTQWLMERMLPGVFTTLVLLDLVA